MAKKKNAQKDIAEERYDPRNKLNDLSNTEWLIATKSIWKSFNKLDKTTLEKINSIREEIKSQLSSDESLEILEQDIPSVLYSTPPPRDELKEQHPATYAETDIEKLIRFFTKSGEKVLDPFLGTGSTLIACLISGRNGIGIELMPKWVDVANRRIKQAFENSIYAQHDLGEYFEKSTEIAARKPPTLQVIQGDSMVTLKDFNDEEFQFIVTSPPYWNILHKDTDHKIKRERIAKGLDTRYGDEEKDLGNLLDYKEFLMSLGNIFADCYRVLQKGKYMCVIVNDFRHLSNFICYHCDLSDEICKHGFSLEGITILVQDSKNLYPYGMPYAFVSNIHHQYVLIFRKSVKASKS